MILLVLFDICFDFLWFSQSNFGQIFGPAPFSAPFPFPSAGFAFRFLMTKPQILWYNIVHNQ